MKSEFLIDRQGKQFCLYAGLLDEAHQQGLKSIMTDLRQIPCAENANVAIATAVVVMVRGDMVQTFTGIGDASPANVARAMQTCLIRFAETRAKARALRDAINVGTASIEEIDDHDAIPVRAAQSAPASRPPDAAPAGATSQSEPAARKPPATIDACTAACRAEMQKRKFPPKQQVTELAFMSDKDLTLDAKLSLAQGVWSDVVNGKIVPAQDVK
jgi:hypothetical protein